MSIHSASPLVLKGPKLRCWMIVVPTDDRSKYTTYLLNMLHCCLFHEPHTATIAYMFQIEQFAA